MQSGILKRLSQLEEKVEVPRLNLTKVSDADLERLEAYFLKLIESGVPSDLAVLPKRLQRVVLESMQPT